MPTKKTTKRGREAMDPRVLPAFDAKAKTLGPGSVRTPSQPAQLTPEAEGALSRASEGLPPARAALLRALTITCLTHPHPTGRCEYRPDELSEWSGLTKKEISAEFPALCAAGLCELSAIGSRDPKPCVRLPWLLPEGGKTE